MPYFMPISDPLDPHAPPAGWCGETDSKDYYNEFYLVSANRHLILGAAMVLLIIFEYFTFAYFPLEKALVVERG